MQLLRDNLVCLQKLVLETCAVTNYFSQTLWTSSEAEGTGEPPAEKKAEEAPDAEGEKPAE